MRSSKQGIKSTRFSLKDGIYKGKTKGLDFYKHYFVEYPSSLGEKQLQIVRWGGGGGGGGAPRAGPPWIRHWLLLKPSFG